MSVQRTTIRQACRIGLWLCAVSAGGADAEPLRVPSLAEPIVLDEGWRFQPGDDPAWAAADFDSDGSPIRVPGSWGRQGYPGVAVGWYRLRLRLDPARLDDETVLALRVGNVSTGYEVYAGGELIGGLAGPPPAMAYDRTATFVVPRRAVDGDGELVLAFRIWRAEAVGRRSGGLRHAPHLGRLEQITRLELDTNRPDLFLALLFAAVGLYHLLLYWLRREERSYLWYSLFVLATGAYTFLTSQWRFAASDDFVLLKELEYLAVFALPALAIQFLWTLLGTPIGRVLRIYQLSHPALGLVAALSPGLDLNLAILSVWTYWSMPAVVVTFSLVLRKAWQGKPEARIICFGVLVLAATYFHSLLAANNIIVGSNLGVYGFLVFVFSMAISLAHRFHRVHRQLDALRSDLEARVEERTRELEEAMVSAEAANRAKSDFLANVSHEIRTPMNAVVGLLELLARIEVPEKARDYLTTLESSAASLLRVIDDILDFSKIEAGKLSLESSDFELRRSVTGVVDLLAPRAAAKGIELRFEIDDGVPRWLRGDPVRLRQVLLNLVGNAVKFTAEGHVELTVEPAAEHEGADDGVFDVRFRVRDTGIGIDPAMRDELFRPFTQADTSATRRFGGTGLGLAISKKIVEAADGAIGFESEPGRGATFWVTWPFEAAEAPPETALCSEVMEAVPSGRILLAEDDPTSQLIARLQLESLGYEVDAVGDGFQVLEALDRQSYDLVLLDCQMPELDGYETARRIRQREVGDRQTPIVAITAHAMEGDREKCLAAGMDDYLSKPYDEKKLADVIGTWLRAD